MKKLLARVALVLVSILPGCGSDPPAPEPPPAPAPPPPPTRVLWKIEAGANVNPDATGRSSPLLVRIYQLKTLTGFNRSDFFSLYQDDNKALAADLVQKEEFTLRPGDQRALDFEPKPETQALAAIAAFRSLDSARWRATVTLAPHSTNSIVVRLTTNQLDMSVEKRGGEGAPP